MAEIATNKVLARLKEERKKDEEEKEKELPRIRNVPGKLKTKLSPFRLRLVTKVRCTVLLPETILSKN